VFSPKRCGGAGGGGAAAHLGAELGCSASCTVGRQLQHIRMCTSSCRRRLRPITRSGASPASPLAAAKTPSPLSCAVAWRSAAPRPDLHAQVPDSAWRRLVVHTQRPLRRERVRYLAATSAALRSPTSGSSADDEAVTFATATRRRNSPRNARRPEELCGGTCSTCCAGQHRCGISAGCIRRPKSAGSSWRRCCRRHRRAAQADVRALASALPTLRAFALVWVERIARARHELRRALPTPLATAPCDGQPLLCRPIYHGPSCRRPLTASAAPLALYCAARVIGAPRRRASRGLGRTASLHAKYKAHSAGVPDPQFPAAGVASREAGACSTGVV